MPAEKRKKDGGPVSARHGTGPPDSPVMENEGRENRLCKIHAEPFFSSSFLHIHVTSETQAAMSVKWRNQIRLLFCLLAADMGLLAATVGVAASWRQREGSIAWAETERMQKTVALTFDDGPNGEYTGELLDGLKKREVQASFFLTGRCIEGNERLVQRMKEEGHLVGVHCLEHVDLTKLRLEDAKRQLDETKSRIQEAAGISPEYIRPPYGSWNEALTEAVSLEPVFWTVDSVDWKLKNTDQIVRHVIKETGDGDVILMHDSFRTSVDAALTVIDILKANGYTFVTVDELSID